MEVKERKAMEKGRTKSVNNLGMVGTVLGNGVLGLTTSRMCGALIKLFLSIAQATISECAAWYTHVTYMIPESS